MKPLILMNCLFLLIACCSESLAIDSDPSGNPYPHGITSSHSNTIVETNNNTFNISSTDTSNSVNKVYSFETFNLHQGEEAIFDDSGIKNSISRVTGESFSWINGKIESQAKNFYFLNPNGIIFGKDASVNTEGAFFLSTADYLEFVDGTNLPVNDLQNNLLSISDPAAFGFIQSDTPGNIEFDQCNLTSFSGDVSIIGNNILMNKTILITRNSEINIVALDYPGKVNLCQKTIDDKEMNSGKIQVTGNSLIKSVLSLYPKSIWIKGEKMISDNSVVHLENEGSEYPGKIMIDVEELIIQNDSEIMSTSNKPEASISKDSGDIIIKSSNFFLTNSDIIVKSETNGNNGDINININNLTIKDDCYIENSTEGIGVIGEIKIHADDKVSINSSYFASMTGYGCDNCTSGDITIDAFDILLDNSIFIFNSGINGDVIFKAINAMSINNSNISTASLFDTYHNYDQKPGNIRLYGKNISFFQSRINSGTSSINNAGSIDIETNFLDIDSSMIRSMSFGEGDAGLININVSNKCNIINAGLFSETFDKGKGGNIFISSPYLSITNDTKIYSRSSMNGIEIFPVGKPGNIIIKSKSFNMIDDVKISVESRSNSDGGDISIYATEIFTIQSDRLEEQTGLFVSAKKNATQVDTCSAGNIFLFTPKLILSGKNVTIESKTETTGTGGNINIEANSLNMENGATISAISTNDGQNAGNAGHISIVADTMSLVSDVSILTEAKNAGGGTISMQGSDTLYMADSQINSSVAYGKDNGGNISLNDHTVLALNHSNILAQANQGNGGNIHISADHLIKSADSMISASSKMGFDGNISIQSPVESISKSVVELPSTFLHAEKWAESPCLDRTGELENYFIMGHRDSIPYMPGDFMASPPVPLTVVFDTMNVSKQHLKKKIVEAEQLYLSGHFADALKRWQYCLDNMPDDSESNFFLISRIAYAYQMMGFHQKALKVLSETVNSKSYHQLLQYRRSDIYLSMGKIAAAQDAINYCDQLPDHISFYTKAAILNHRGIIQAILGEYDDAINSFEKSLFFLKNSTMDPYNLQITVSFNKARLETIFTGNTDIDALSKLLPMISNQNENYQKAINLIELLSFIENADSQQLNFSKLNQKAVELLLHIDCQHFNDRLKALINNYISKFYLNNHLLSEAESYIKEAIFYASLGKYPEVLSQCDYIKGQIHSYAGNTEKAIICYQTAISLIQPILQEYYAGRRMNKGFFEDFIRPIYLSLARLLFSKSQKISIKDALQSMEELKTAEIENFFKDECISQTKKVYSIAEQSIPGTAIIYPVIFDDQVNIVCISPKGFTVNKYPISRSQIITIARRFNKHLNESFNDEYQTYGRLLYEYLIEPIESILTANNIHTLVVVPDDILRLVPFAALHDGHQYLIERYAIITTPGLKWFDMKSGFNQAGSISNRKMLLCGLSKSFQGMSASPYIDNEMQQISKKIPCDILLNESFFLSEIRNHLIKKNYPMIHIATHGVFTGCPETSFLLTAKEKITMDQLKQLLNMHQYEKRTIDLLTLSACQTGKGNERSVLGLAGTALKAGVNNVLATLWSVNDLATSMIMEAFYNGIINHISKASALQFAQKEMIHSDNYHHPFFWAAFILVGDSFD
jgi:filamentous hemagglutinin family protein